MMGVDVVQVKSRFPEGLKLCTDLRLQLTSHLLPEKKTNSGADEMRRELTVLVHQIGDNFWGQDWRSVYQYQMQANFQRWKTFGSLHRIFGGLRSHHQTRSG